MKTFLLTAAPCIFLAAAAFSQADAGKFDAALAAKIREFKADRGAGEVLVSVIIQHESPLSDDELSRLLAPRKGKLKRRIATLNISVVELPISQLESLAAESGVKRVSLDGPVKSGR